MTAKAKLDGKDIEYNEKKKKWESSELGTLKDIPRGSHQDGTPDIWVATNNLQSDAIKWIKSNSPYLNDCDGAVSNWIKHYFNLTEEDLK